MSKRLIQLGLVSVVLATGGIVLAQESEFQAKIQEDLDGYKKQIVENCTATDKLTLKWEGKLGSNPRESEKPEYNAVTTLCTSALDALSQTCQSNGVVKKAASKLNKVVCTKGKGTIGYSLKGSVITFSVDPSFTKNNAAGQESDLVEKMKKDLDK
jgi:hypothetical protein